MTIGNASISYVDTQISQISYINDGTSIIKSKSINSDGGSITSDGSGNLTAVSTTLSGALKVGGTTTLNGILNITNTSGMLTLNSSGTKQSWYMRRSVSSITSNMYTVLSSYNGTSSNAVTFYDDGSITTSLGTVANLATNNSFTGYVSATQLVASGSIMAANNDFVVTSDGTMQLNGDANVSGDLTTNKLNVTGTTMMNGGFTAQGTCQVTTPATSDNSTNIATTAWVNAQGYSTSSSGNYLPLSGGTVSGNITVTGSIINQNSDSIGTQILMPTSSTSYRWNINSLASSGNTFDTCFSFSGGVKGVDGMGQITVSGASITLPTTVCDALTSNGEATVGSLVINGTGTATTPTTTDNSTNVATTAYVQNQGYATLAYLKSIRGIQNADISASGATMTLTIPNENIIITLKNTSSTSASISYAATTGTITPVDIRRVTMYGGGSNETYTMDGGTLTTTPTVVDDTVYTVSNDTSAHFIRVNGNSYVITVWISGGGARSSLIYEKFV